jgi:hypothetical protein
MITLDIPTEPRWVDLPHGVSVRVRPVTTAVIVAAQSATRRALEEVPEAERQDAALMAGFGFAALVEALARYAIVEWQGVGDAAGEPLALTPERAALLMRHEDMATAFWDAIYRPVRALAAEGNA